MQLINLDDIPKGENSHNPRVSKQVMISRGQIPQFTHFTKAVFPPGEIAGEHIHQDLYEIFFVDSGVGQMRVNGQLYQLEAGSCITIEPGEAHELSNNGDNDLVVKYFGVEV